MTAPAVQIVFFLFCVKKTFTTSDDKMADTIRFSTKKKTGMTFSAPSQLHANDSRRRRSKDKRFLSKNVSIFIEILLNYEGGGQN